MTGLISPRPHAGQARLTDGAAPELELETWLQTNIASEPVRRERPSQLLADWQRGGFTEFTGKRFIVGAAARQLKQSSLTAGGF